MAMAPRRAGRRSQPKATAATVNVVDSSGWLEYFAGTDRADLFAPAIEDTERLVVPVVTVYEVFKKVRRERDEHTALLITAQMQQGHVEPVDAELCLHAATLGLPLADSLIYATCLRAGAALWTQDAHFEGLAGVRYFAKSAG
jgi:predicted nucleic acid-binding protein